MAGRVRVAAGRAPVKSPGLGCRTGGAAVVVEVVEVEEVVAGTGRAPVEAGLITVVVVTVVVTVVRTTESATVWACAASGKATSKAGTRQKIGKRDISKKGKVKRLTSGSRQSDIRKAGQLAPPRYQLRTPGARRGPADGLSTQRNPARVGIQMRQVSFFRPKFVLSPFMSQPISAAPPRIQPATLKDIPVIMTLAEATWEPTYRFIISKEQLEYMYRVIYTPASLRRQIEEQHHTFLLAYVDERPAGFASFSPQPAAPQHQEDGGGAPSLPPGLAFKLHKIYVMPSHQGQGLGVRLLEAVEQAAQAAQGQFLDLNVNRHNEKALGFYERHGYHRQRAEDVPIGPYWMKDFIMRKAL